MISDNLTAHSLLLAKKEGQGNCNGWQRCKACLYDNSGRFADRPGNQPPSALDEKRVHCPLPEEYSCETLLLTMKDARKHSKSHCARYPCPEADIFHCTETFSRRDYALKRVKMTHGSRWLCTVPLCYRTIARFPYTKRSIENHEDPQRTWGFGRPERRDHTNRHLRNHGPA